MAIELDDGARKQGTPVVKRTKIGEKFLGAIVEAKWRDVQKMDEITRVSAPVLKPNGKPKQEMVVVCVSMPGTTALAGIGDEVGVPEPGDVVRVIVRGKQAGDWIDGKKAHRNNKLIVGDILRTVVELAQCYDANGSPKGNAITDQATADAVPRSTTMGYYGPLTLHVPTAEHAQWVDAAEKAHRALTEIVLDNPEPFATAPADDIFGDL
jgi:hypothetical protein